MVGEPAAVSRRELPRLELAQVREDLPRATIKPSVLRLQDRDLVGTGECPAARSAPPPLKPTVL